MTLDTHIRIEKTMPVKDVFDYALGLLDSTGTAAFEPCAWGTGWMTSPESWLLRGWLSVSHAPDGPQACPHWSHEENDEDEDGAHECLPPAAMTVSLDTGYGYRADNGAGCEDLHAWFVGQIYDYVTANGGTIRWQNEFTGEWFIGLDSLDTFGDMALGAPSEKELARS